MCADFKKRTNKVLLAEGKGVPVISEGFVDACRKAGKLVGAAAFEVGSSRIQPAAAAAAGGVAASKKRKQASPKQTATAAPKAKKSKTLPLAVPLSCDYQWSWAGDTPGNSGAQDMWVEYDTKFCCELEAAKTAGKARLKVDSERFIDLVSMEQKRYDDEHGRRRAVQRAAKSSAKPPPPGQFSSQAAIIVDSDSDDAGSSSADPCSDQDEDDDEEEDEDDGESEGEGESESESEDEDDDSENVKWFWKGDSAGSASGSQDIWVEYDSKASKRFEAARQAGSAEAKVDAQRLIDLKGMYQCRSALSSVNTLNAWCCCCAACTTHCRLFITLNPKP